MQFLNTLDGLLEHIKDVETETIHLTRESQMRLVKFIEEKGLKLDDETLEAMQYQDIISQQLSATIEAIESAQQHLKHFKEAMEEDDAIMMQSIQEMHSKLNGALERAKEKHSAFGGKLQHDDDGIEFF